MLRYHVVANSAEFATIDVNKTHPQITVMPSTTRFPVVLVLRVNFRLIGEEMSSIASRMGCGRITLDNPITTAPISIMTVDRISPPVNRFIHSEAKTVDQNMPLPTSASIVLIASRIFT